MEKTHNQQITTQITTTEKLQELHTINNFMEKSRSRHQKLQHLKTIQNLEKDELEKNTLKQQRVLGLLAGPTQSKFISYFRM